MLHLIFYVFIISIASDVVQGCNGKSPQVPEGFTLHNVMASWDKAHHQCQSEGAVLASPINDYIVGVMKSLIEVYNTSFYTGIKTSYSGQYISIEGVPFENMSVALWQQLDPSKGDCLSMSCDTIHPVPCWHPLPYMCYYDKNGTDTLSTNKTNCTDGYQYKSTTKHCYKVHTESLSWDRAHWTCVAEGGYLAIIDDNDEEKLIKDISYYNSPKIWIGLRDSTGGGNWISVKGQPLKEIYHNWRYHEPVDKYGLCGTFHHVGALHYGVCEHEYPFVCEKETTI